MDNTNPVSEERTASKKEKLLLYVVPSPTNTGTNTYEEKDQHLESSLLHKTMIVGGAVLILTNITLITLASLKVFGVITSP
jgi:hypothetical protein